MFRPRRPWKRANSTIVSSLLVQQLKSREGEPVELPPCGVERPLTLLGESTFLPPSRCTRGTLQWLRTRALTSHRLGTRILASVVVRGAIVQQSSGECVPSDETAQVAGAATERPIVALVEPVTWLRMMLKEAAAWRVRA